MLLLSSCAGGGDEGDGESAEARCTRVRDRLVELKLDDTSVADRAAHAKAMRSALGDDFVTRCASSLSDAQRTCVLEATDSLAAAACSNR